MEVSQHSLFLCYVPSLESHLFNNLPWANLSGAKFTQDVHKRTKEAITKQEASEYAPNVHKVQRLWNVCQGKLPLSLPGVCHEKKELKKTREGEPCGAAVKL